jgi:transposase
MAAPRLPIAPHLSHDEITRRYRACRDGREKTHWQAIWLLTGPEASPSPARVAEALGLSAGSVRALVKRWNAEGPAGLADRRKAANGGQSKIGPEQRAELLSATGQPPPDGGLWTGPKVAAYVRGRWGVEVRPKTGREWLRGLGFSLQVPRPSHPEAATPAERRAWKRRPGRPDGRAAPPEPRQARRALGRG